MKTTEPVLKIYRGFSNRDVTYIMGHVLRRSSDPPQRVTRNPLKNALEMFRRYRVKPAKNQLVELSMAGRKWETRSDYKGYFEFKFETPKVGELECVVGAPEWGLGYTVHMPVVNPDVVVISDIDDTVLVSHATNLLKKLYLLLTKNHERRKGFEGTKQFYEELLGANGTLFYVSSSEWNLYDFLSDFMSFNQMPNGVFLLQDIKSGIMDLFKSGGGSHSHKIIKINKILEAYPHAEFVLIGDSGQRDPDIYERAVERNPGRIRQVFIRDVRKATQKRLNQVAESLKERGVAFEVLHK